MGGRSKALTAIPRGPCLVHARPAEPDGASPRIAARQLRRADTRRPAARAPSRDRSAARAHLRDGCSRPDPPDERRRRPAVRRKPRSGRMPTCSRASRSVQRRESDEPSGDRGTANGPAPPSAEHLVLPGPRPARRDGGRWGGLRPSDVSNSGDLRAEREAFLEVLSHELRTPLTTIYAGSSVLARRPRLSGPATRTLAMDISLEAARLYDLVENLLVIARLERQILHPLDEPVDLGRAMDTAIRPRELPGPGRPDHPRGPGNGAAGPRRRDLRRPGVPEPDPLDAPRPERRIGVGAHRPSRRRSAGRRGRVDGPR